MNGTSDRCKPVYPHTFSKPGYKKSFFKINWTNTGKNKHEKAGSRSHETIHHFHLLSKYDYSSLLAFTAIFDEKFIFQNMERKKI